MTTRNFDIDKLDLEKSIAFGLEVDISQSRMEEIYCGSTVFDEFGNGWCKFFYCWDDGDPNYYHMSVSCLNNGEYIHQDIE